MQTRKKSLASRTVLAAAQCCMATALAACATAIQVRAPSHEQATGSVPAIAPGHRLEKFRLCYEMRRPQASPLETPVKRFSIEVSLLVPRDDCLALDANGWLRGVPGQCTHMPAQSSCEDPP